MNFSAHLETWPLSSPFRIAGREWREIQSLVVEISEEGLAGRGEAQGVFYLNETAETIYRQANGIAAEIRAGLSRQQLQTRLPAGGARNAIDCAMWDLECKKQSLSIWDLTGIVPQEVTTVFTIGVETSPAAMAEKAAKASTAPLLKIKLDKDRPLEKLTEIRAARPDARLVVDANQGWDLALLEDVLAKCGPLDLEMIEQPLPRGEDQALEALDAPVLLAADESCQDRQDLATASQRYGMLNVKLDKTGGLTEAIALVAEARRSGMKIMVGNMMGTSLSMAPAFVLAQLSDFVDIDGPLLLQHDRIDGLTYSNGRVQVPNPELWGGTGSK